MRNCTEIGVVLACTTALFAGGCSAETAPPEPPSSISSIAPSPDSPNPSSEPTPTPDFSEACTDEVARDAVGKAYNTLYEPLVASLEALPQEQLVSLQRDNLGTLATISILAGEISEKFGNITGDAAIEIPNAAQPGQSFSHIADLEMGTISMDDWLFSEDGEYCKISSVTTEISPDATRNKLTVKLGRTVYNFLLADGTIQMSDGGILTPSAVATTNVLAERYFSIVDAAAKNPETFEFATEAPSQPVTVDT